jgi:fatty acid desaturase
MVFKPSDKLGLIHSGAVASTTVAGFILSRFDGITWIAGQLLVAVALVQWFIILHECGHETLFRRPFLNVVTGHVAAFFSGIPFVCWKRVHGLHHRWTGWQDLDPTTAALVPRELSRLETFILRTSWKYWIPLFSVLYRINNYWHLPRLRALFKDDRKWKEMALSALGLVSLYGIVIYLVGLQSSLHAIGLGLFLAFLIEDPLILSQHTHIPQNNSRGKDAQSFPAIEQEVFTRSLHFPSWVSKALLFNFDAHELHHMYPFVPGYHLRRIPYTGNNEIDWWHWVTAAKRMRGDEFLFKNQNDTGIRV